MLKIRNVLILPFVLSLVACESSMRLPSLGNPFGESQRVTPQISAAPAPRVRSVPLEPPVSQQELAPLPGMPQPQFEQPSVNAPSLASEPPLDTPKAAKTELPKVASRSAPNSETRVTPTRNSVTGNWSATEASGSSCKLTLSSSPKLDLYNAGTSGCQNKDLQKIMAWELQGEEVYLYESGGAVAARLKPSGNGRFNGALSKTGAPITLSK